jgi:hypothetical protein
MKSEEKNQVEADVEMSIFYDTYYQFDDEDWFPGMPYPGRWL